jgi:hypothetical protein
MNDPHVTALHYMIEPAKSTDYDKAPPLTGQTDTFDYTLASGEATFVMKSHFATEEEARGVVDPFLRAWSIHAGVDNIAEEITFHFKKADMIDRQPISGEGVHGMGRCVIRASAHASGTFHVSRARFPSPPPQQFALSPDVETMYLRYRAYRQKRETLLSAAYMCLTVLEASLGPNVRGKRQAVCDKYRIDLTVRKTFGDLVSERGGASEARKMPGTGPLIPLTEGEKRWIEAAVRRLILRAGEYSYDPNNLPMITMNDFPALP